MSEQEVTITGNDIQSVSQKLEQFGSQLPPNERVVIDWLLDRAASAPAESPEQTEVQGYFYSGLTSGPLVSPLTFNQQFNNALGLNRSGITVTGSIRVRF